VTLGGGRLWRWVSLAAPAGRRRGGGGDGGAFVDVTLRFHDAATAEGATITSFEFAEHEAAEHEASRSVGLPAAAVGWSDGTVTAHARDDAEPGDPFAFRVAWRAAEHSKAVSAVRWHPSAGDPASPRHAWLGSVSADGGFLVYDGRDGEAVRSAPPSRRSLTDLAWRPAGAAAAAAAARSDAGDRLSAREAPLDASDAIAVTTGADGVVRGWDLSSSPAPAATMRGHEGRALFAAWAGARAARRARGAPTATLVTGSDDQTVRAWEVDDLCHSPAAEAEASARAKEAKQAKKLARDAEAKRGGEPTARSEGDGSADAEAASATSSTEPTEITKDSGTDTLQSAGGASGKKKRKGTGGRGIVKPPPWETTPEGIAAGRASAVRLARLLARRNTVGSPGVAADGSDESLDDASAGYGPRGLGLYLGQEEAMRLLRLEESVCGGDGAGAPGSEPAEADGVRHRRASDIGVSSSSDGGSGALRPPERAAAAALFRGDFETASESLFAAFDGPIPPDFLAALVGGGRALYASAAATQADRLEARGEHQRAAVLRLSLHDVRGAIGSLRRGGLERDAAALAAARLLPIDPLLVETRVALAAAEETRGGAEAAAKAHLSAGRVGAAVRALARPGVGGARAAAEVALVMGARGAPEKHAVLRAAKDAEAQGDLADAADVLERWTERGAAEPPAGSAGADGDGVQGGSGGGGEDDTEIQEVLAKIRISLEAARETAERRDDGSRDVAGADDEG
jgi:gem associated protein 5